MDEETRQAFATAGNLIQQLAQMQIEHEQANQRAFERFERLFEQFGAEIAELKQLIGSNARAIQALSDRESN
ncbi:DUF2019 domain-containing protein [Synechococcus sp. PCC 7336]|uniref:DUF2019 domain-containing protein n=1 Tax=Synechococcus sp. PCC 7336 TaxID=195250 RepID=UPI00034CC529|nr:DUF2019 domain-containing protein [Synechococcus sp. PCC 7336]